jgi:hypothetical protein
MSAGAHRRSHDRAPEPPAGQVRRGRPDRHGRRQNPANWSRQRLTLIWRTSPRSSRTRFVITVQTRPSKVVNRVLPIDIVLADAALAKARLADQARSGQNG